MARDVQGQYTLEAMQTLTALKNPTSQLIDVAFMTS